MTNKVQNSKTGSRNGWDGKQDTVFAPGRILSVYTWPGDFPVFYLSPGRLNGKSGIVAKHKSGLKELFAFNARPEAIAQRLDDLILQIMRHDTALAAAPLFDDCEIDIDDWMVAHA